MLVIILMSCVGVCVCVFTYLVDKDGVKVAQAMNNSFERNKLHIVHTQNKCWPFAQMDQARSGGHQNYRRVSRDSMEREFPDGDFELDSRSEFLDGFNESLEVRVEAPFSFLLSLLLQDLVWVVRRSAEILICY